MAGEAGHPAPPRLPVWGTPIEVFDPLPPLPSAERGQLQTEGASAWELDVTSRGTPFFLKSFPFLREGMTSGRVFPSAGV